MSDAVELIRSLERRMGSDAYPVVTLRDLTGLADELDRLRAEVERLRTEAAEEATRNLMRDILQRTAVALKGPEPELTRWGWDDLPEIAERLRVDAERYRWLRDVPSDWAICEWMADDPDGIGYYRDGRAAHVVDAAIDAAIRADRAAGDQPT